MKYLCLCYYDPNVANALSADEAQELAAVCKPHYEDWEKSGKLVAFGALSDPQAWKTVRPTDTGGNVEGRPEKTGTPTFLHNSQENSIIPHLFRRSGL